MCLYSTQILQRVILPVTPRPTANYLPVEAILPIIHIAVTANFEIMFGKQKTIKIKYNESESGYRPHFWYVFC